MSRIIGDRTGKSTLDDMMEVSRQRNRDVEEEERLERLKAARKEQERTPESQPSGDIIGKPKGILYGTYGIGTYGGLWYYSLNDKKNIPLKKVRGAIHSIYADADHEVYFTDNGDRDKNYSVRTLFGESRYERPNRVAAIYQRKVSIVDAGEYGLKDTLTGTLLMDERHIESITSYGSCLYALIREETKNSFKLIANSLGFFHTTSKIEYKAVSVAISQAICVPYRTSLGEEFIPYSVISCAHYDYIDINNTKVEGTEEKDRGIYRVALLGCENNIADIAYGGAIGQIMHARLDLNEKKLIEKHEIIRPIVSLHSLNVVHYESMHEKILDYYNANKDKIEEKDIGKRAADTLKKAEELLPGDEDK